MLLILGAGNKPHTGANVVNHDIIKHRPEIDVAWDLNEFPWPWADDTFDTVQAWAVLEHLRADRLQIFNELWRITKPGGVAAIKLPAWDSEHAHDDIHEHPFRDRHVHPEHLHGDSQSRSQRQHVARNASECQLQCDDCVYGDT